MSGVCATYAQIAASLMDILDRIDSQNREGRKSIMKAQRQDVGGLASLLEKCSLQESLRTATDWCLTQGITNVEMLIDAEMEGEFAEALSAKPAPRKLLMRHLANMKASVDYL